MRSAILSVACSFWVTLAAYGQSTVKDSIIAAKMGKLSREIAAGGTISGFASFRWGTTAGEVTKKLGAPRDRTPLAALESEVLEYSDRLLGHAVEASYWITAKGGLVSGMYVIDLSYKEPCEQTFEELNDALKARYPQLLPIEARASDSPDMDFCTQFALSRAERRSHWDEGNGNFVDLQLPRGESKVYLRYGTFLGHELLERARALMQSERAKDIKEKL